MIFFTKNPNLKDKKVFFFMFGGGGEGGRGGEGAIVREFSLNKNQM